MKKEEANVKLAGNIALLKAQASQTLEFCAREALQIFGGLAYPNYIRVVTFTTKEGLPALCLLDWWLFGTLTKKFPKRAQAREA
jgi:Acyl-CoA dehydrogenase, C-terminal domain